MISSESPRAPFSGRALGWWGLGIALLFWILESVLDGWVLRGDGFVRELLAPPLPELWMRLLIFGLLVGFGWYAHRVARTLRARHAQEQGSRSGTIEHGGGRLIQLAGRCARANLLRNRLVSLPDKKPGLPHESDFTRGAKVEHELRVES